jgi:hypothetical protein
MKTYTITTDGISNGNVIAQPFTIKVEQMLYTENQFQTALIVSLCTMNGSDCVCANDDIPSQNKFELPVMTSSKNSDLAATVEVLLQEVYPGNWS